MTTIYAIKDICCNPLNICCQKVQSRISNILPRKVKEIASRISPLAIDTLIKLGTSIAINCALITFFALPFGAPITIAWLSHALLMSTIYAIPKIAFDIYMERKTEDIITKGINHLSGFSMVNTIGLGGLNPWIHELGHGLAAVSLFKNPQVSIKVKPFSHGETSYYVSNGLTRLGRLLGKENCILFVTGAGMMASTLVGMLEFAGAYSLKDRFPALSQLMNYHAISQILNDVVYGLTAFVARRPNLAHDFIRLSQTGGIHPLIPIGLMIALPVIEIVLFELFERRQKSKKAQAVASQILLDNLPV